MPKVLIGIHACEQDRGLNIEAARGTWIRQWQPTHKFFFGGGGFPEGEDEVVSEIPDHYTAMPYKVKRAAAYAVEHDFDALFMACMDTYVIVPTLMKSGFTGYLYSGRKCPGGHASGGFGYGLDVQACRILMNAPVYEGYEDVWVYHSLVGAGVHLTEMLTPMTAHLSRGTGRYHSEWMFQFHRDLTGGFNA